MNFCIKDWFSSAGEGGKQKEFKNSGHALQIIFKREGFKGIYTGYVQFQESEIIAKVKVNRENGLVTVTSSQLAWVPNN